MGAHKLKQRASPRYRFSANDREVIRFISSKQSRILSTVIIDISETGVGFLTSQRLAPHIGEIIKMDFAPLGSMRMACQGRVIHMEAPPQNTGWGKFPGTVKVGVQFYNLPREYQKVLNLVLRQAFDVTGRTIPEYKDVTVRRKSPPGWLRQNIWSVLTTFVILVGVGFGIYKFINYDPDENPVQQEPTWASSFFERTLHK